MAASYSADASQLFSVRTEHLHALLNPVKLAVHRPMGRWVDRIYVACQGTNSIGVFERDSFGTGVQLYYREALHVGSTQNAGDESAVGVSLHGINDLAVQGNFLYTASSLAHGGGCIHVFEIASNGSLSEKPSMRMLAAHNFGLRGVSAITVGFRRLFAASKVDEAIAAFARDEISGALKYEGHVLNGERLLDRFVTGVTEVEPGSSSTSAQSVSQSEVPGQPVSWYDGKFPVQMGHGLPWGDSAHFVLHCQVDGKELFVVVTGTSGAHSSRVESRVLIYEWLTDTFIVHSELQKENSTLHVEHFSRQEAGDTEWHFLVLSNAQGPSTLYRFNRDRNRFFFFNVLPMQLADGTVLPPHCADDGKVACNSLEAYVLPGIKDPVPPWGDERPNPAFRKAHVFTIESSQFLAVAAWWPSRSVWLYLVFVRVQMADAGYHPGG